MINYSNVLHIIYKVMRKLAKSNKYQMLYSQYKETGIRIFINQHTFTDCQLAFLQYLSFYSSIYTDIYMDDVSDIVLEDEVYEDSYTYYKQKIGRKKRRERKQNLNNSSQASSKKQNKQAVTSNTHIVFSKAKLNKE